MLKTEGDRVAAGELLAELDPEIYRNSLALATARLDETRAKLTELENGSRPEEKERALADVAAARALRDNAEQVFERQRALLQSQTVSQQDFDNAKMTLDADEAKLRSAEKTQALVNSVLVSREIDQLSSRNSCEKSMIVASRSVVNSATVYRPG